MDAEDKFPEVKTSHQALMEHSDGNDLNLRIVNSITGSSLMCVVLEELHDSFLVALPSRLLANKEQRLVEPHMPVRFARMFKPCIISMIPCYGEFEAFYLHYLLTKGNEHYPELYTVTFTAKLQKRFDAIKEGYFVKKDPAPLVQSEENTADPIVMPLGTGRYKH
jgi:hypothetical protein